MSARFAFRSRDFSVEFRGTEAWVTEQVDRVRDRILEVLTRAKGAGEEPGEGNGEATGTAPLEEFYLKARTRQGRGDLQDSILIFALYLHTRQNEPEFSIEDLNFCFDLLNKKRPRSLANTLGILKRERGWLEKGSRRGTYTLTTRGRERAESMLL
jgi:hypothetical protein